MESEPAGVPGLAANVCGQKWLGIRFLHSPRWRMNRSGCRRRLESERARQLAGAHVLRPPLMDSEAAEVRSPARTRAGVKALGGRDLRYPPGRCRAGARAGFERQYGISSRRARHLHLPLATTQPVDGARLISGYSAVRLRGGQLAGSSGVRAPILYIGNQSPVRFRPGLPFPPWRSLANALDF